MLKASTLYIVVIVSLLIAMISASLLTIAFYYRLEVQKKVRFDKLLVNTSSGTEILLSEGFSAYDKDQVSDLFEEQKDSLVLRKEIWGVYELGLVKAFELKDTLKRSFFAGTTFLDPNVIYLADEDRPLSLSGKTQLIGDGELPKSGLKQSYVDGKPYEGKELIKGKITESSRGVPPLNETLLGDIEKKFNVEEGAVFNVRDSVSNSFFNPVLLYKLTPDQQEITDVKLKGKIILVSDTIVNISATAVFEDVQVYAPAIIVASGFKGTCQLFARDSIVIGKDCAFGYPSFAGVFKSAESKIQSKISIGKGVTFSGVLLSYEKKRTDLQTMISIGEKSHLRGEVFATGYIKMERGITVYGKVYAKRFIMQTPSTLYENYLIDITLNRNLLSKYYLSSMMFKRGTPERRILKWLN
ncbi:hypothetical protein SAMN05421820_107153 [Pedobacter steynii]|uniref:Uncharacterized protein n=1 Tax=Pedobacter steynii TaxID=430522 RepID=A0A1H0APR8_9SPHI|nr:hypothetical protein [Pedobacter steynii]NQX41305.1 hypothetical protein [Pedobacter steynii]SDN35063.1 hypothetical protein SAMN05421820_107153 [Pedobacter steynii]